MNTDALLLNRRKFLLGLGFAATAGVAAARQPRTNVDFLGDRKLEDLIPKTIGEWEFAANSGLVVPPEDQLLQATYSQLLTRVYTAEGRPPMMLLVAQSSSQTGILQIHRPEFCYAAGGFSLSETTVHPIDVGGRSFEALALQASNDDRTEQIVFWTRIGERLPSSWREQKIAVALDNLNGIIPDAVMVRLSTFGTNRASALAMMDRFVAQMIASVPPTVRRVLIG